MTYPWRDPPESGGPREPRAPRKPLRAIGAIAAWLALVVGAAVYSNRHELVSDPISQRDWLREIQRQPWPCPSAVAFEPPLPGRPSDTIVAFSCTLPDRQTTLRLHDTLVAPLDDWMAGPCGWLPWRQTRPLSEAEMAARSTYARLMEVPAEDGPTNWDERIAVQRALAQEQRRDPGWDERTAALAIEYVASTSPARRDELAVRMGCRGPIDLAPTTRILRREAAWRSFEMALLVGREEVPALADYLCRAGCSPLQVGTQDAPRER